MKTHVYDRVVDGECVTWFLAGHKSLPSTSGMVPANQSMDVALSGGALSVAQSSGALSVACTVWLVCIPSLTVSM